MLTLTTVIVLISVGCSASGTPATTPPSVPAMTIATTTSTLPPTTTTTAATTTTVDRVAEIEAIFQDLEERRLQALYEGDEEAFKALFANKEYMQRSLGAFEAVEFAPGWSMPTVDVVEVLYEDSSCIAVRTATDYSDVFTGDDGGEWIEVVERTNGGWGLSYAGEGWACEGPHPFSP